MVSANTLGFTVDNVDLTCSFVYDANNLLPFVEILHVYDSHPC